MTGTAKTMAQLDTLLTTAARRGGLDDLDTRALRATMLAAGPSRAAVDTRLAAAWRAADANLRVHGLRDLFDGVMLGSALVDALLESIDGACAAPHGRSATTEATPVDAGSANAALWVLREAADDPLDSKGWRRICAVARRGRHQLVPDLDAANLVAERGPDSCLPTVALTAFRDGPEDASDRLAALVALGRFPDPRVPGWLHGVVRSGAGLMEAVQALSFVAARVHGDGDEAALGQVIEALLVAVPVSLASLEDAGSDPASQAGSAGVAASAAAASHLSDGWVRWLALDLLSRLLGEATVPMLQAAYAAGGQHDVAWFLPQVEARLHSLGAPCPADDATALPWIPPLPDLGASILSRCPRVARRAAVLAAESPALQGALQTRAAVERTLVARGQLLASFLDAEGLPAVDLDADFQPWSEVMTDRDRAALVAMEDAWIG